MDPRRIAQAGASTGSNPDRSTGRPESACRRRTRTSQPVRNRTRSRSLRPTFRARPANGGTSAEAGSPAPWPTSGSSGPPRSGVGIATERANRARWRAGSSADRQYTLSRSRENPIRCTAEWPTSSATNRPIGRSIASSDVARSPAAAGRTSPLRRTGSDPGPIAEPPPAKSRDRPVTGRRSLTEIDDHIGMCRSDRRNPPAVARVTDDRDPAGQRRRWHGYQCVRPPAKRASLEALVEGRQEALQPRPGYAVRRRRMVLEDDDDHDPGDGDDRLDRAAHKRRNRAVCEAQRDPDRGRRSRIGDHERTGYPALSRGRSAGWRRSATDA